MSLKKACLLTNDVETTSIWHNALRDRTGEKVLKEGMPLLLDLYQRYDIRSTFFFTGFVAKKFPEMVRMVLSQVHEVGCHGLSHEPDNALDLLDYRQQVKQLQEARNMLEDISGEEVISFRAPALRVNEFTPAALDDAGFRIDSSIASQRFDMFLSFGSIKKFNRLFAPRLPYRADRSNLNKAGEGPVIEIPISAFIMPYIGTTLRIFPLLTRLLRYFLHAESGFNRKPLVFLFHPNELIDESAEPTEKKRRAKNLFSYLLADLFRHKLKMKNLGPAALPIYEREIEFFHKKQYPFLTVKDYCRQAGFLH